MTEPPPDPDSPPGRSTERAPSRPTDDGAGFVLDPRPAADLQVAPVVTAHASGQSVTSTATTTTATVLGADGREYPAEVRRTNAPASSASGASTATGGGARTEVRYPVAVIETKVPYAQRPTRGLLDTDAQCAERGYGAVFQPLDPTDPASQRGAPDAPDDDPLHGVGVESWWYGWFTEAERDELEDAPSVRSATWQTVHAPIGHPRRLA